MSFERTMQMDNSIILPVFGQFDANIKKIEKLKYNEINKIELEYNL